jgi:hypothetical protein
MMHGRNQSIVTGRDWCVLAACLAFVSYAVPLLLDVWGGNLLHGEHAGLLVALTALAVVPGVVEIVAAWRGNRVILWAMAVGSVAIWVLGWRSLPILTPAPILFVATALIGALAVRRKHPAS